MWPVSSLSTLAVTPSPAWLQPTLVGVFYVLVLGVGLVASRRVAGLGASELLLAGRRLPLLVGAFTMTATWVGGGYINGTAEVVYNVGAEGGGLYWAQAPWGYALSLVLGGLFFARTMRRRGYTTLLDPFSERYGRHTAALLYVPALVGEIFWTAAILAALGMTFSVIVGWSLTTAILVSAALALAYTVVGGLWSVAMTDVVQLLLLFLGLCLALPFAMSAAGGSSEAVASYVDLLPEPPSGPSRWSWLDFALLLALGGIPWQVYFQRVLACRDDRAAVGLSLLAAVGCVLLAIPAALIGAAGAVVWAQAPEAGPPSASVVLPWVLRTLTPSPVAAIGLAAVAAAVMSSVDSSVLSASSMFSWNVYRPLVRPRAGDRELRLVLRLAVVVVGAAATWLALAVGSVYALWVLCADLVYVILFPQLVAVLFFRRADARGALAGGILGLVLRASGGESQIGLPAFLPYDRIGEWLPTFGTEFPFRTFSMLACLVAIPLFSAGPGRRRGDGTVETFSSRA